MTPFNYVNKKYKKCTQDGDISLLTKVNSTYQKHFWRAFTKNSWINIPQYYQRPLQLFFLFAKLKISFQNPFKLLAGNRVKKFNSYPFYSFIFLLQFDVS